MSDAPPRELLVLRHAKSAWDSEAATDRERPLSARGKRDAPRMGAWLSERGWIPDAVVSSPAKRAVKTTKKVLRAMGLGVDDVRIDDRIYGATVGTVLDILAEAPSTARRVLLVGHNPTLEEIVEWLAADASDRSRDDTRMPTCAVARLSLPEDWRDLRPGDGRLLGLYRPKEMFV